MKKCTDAIVDWLIKCEVVSEGDKEIYIYATYSFLMSLSPLILAVFFGMLMGNIKESVTLIIPFVIIRKFSGGYHTKHSWSCFILSCLLLFCCIVLTSKVKCGWGLALITILSSMSLIFFSPIDNINRRLSLFEKKRYRKVVKSLVFIFLIIAMLLFMCHLHSYSICVSIGIILSACLQIPCILSHILELGKKIDQIHS